MVNYKKYDNGLKIIVNTMDAMMSVSAGILVGAGSCLENADNNGISHFIEHTTFKGTEKMTSFELSSAFDDIGAQVNAFTSKETTCYYVKSTAGELEKSFELLSDMFLNSVYEKEELEKEKGVVKEEINMCLDTPEDLCLDALSESYFGKQGLGRTILGPSKNIDLFTKEDVLKYRERFYNADNIVLSFAGRITFERACELAEKFFGPFVSAKKSDELSAGETENTKGRIKIEKNIEQIHLALAFKGVEYNAPTADAMSVVNNVLGSGMSSRLFQKIREEMGLCYTVYSYPSCYRSTGTFAVYAGVNPKSAEKAYIEIKNVLNDFKAGGITDTEFERGKAQMISSFAFGQESTSSQMLLYGRYLMVTGGVFDMDKKLASVVSLKKDAVTELISAFDFSSYSAAIVGKKIENITL